MADKGENVTGIIYILTNPSMDGLVKIGRTDQKLEERLSQLYNTSVPFPFECYYACKVEDALDVEKRLHYAFHDLRVNNKREFFKISPDRVETILQTLALEEVFANTEEDSAGNLVDETDKTASAKENERKANFSFDLLNIDIGSELTFVKDENVKAIVYDSKNVEYNDNIISTSKAAKEAMHDHDEKYKGSSYAGPLYWKFGEKTLQEIRDELEDQ